MWPANNQPHVKDCFQIQRWLRLSVFLDSVWPTRFPFQLVTSNLQAMVILPTSLSSCLDCKACQQWPSVTILTVNLAPANLNAISHAAGSESRSPSVRATLPTKLLFFVFAAALLPWLFGKNLRSHHKGAPALRFELVLTGRQETYILTRSSIFSSISRFGQPWSSNQSLSWQDTTRFCRSF